MKTGESYFFCGVGGSGMAPLALIVEARGAKVDGSDRALDQGRTPAKFDFLRRQGVTLHPQDGSGMTRADQTLVVSAAVEESIPDVQAARRLGAPIMTRAQLLASLFNAAGAGVGVAGTSGKSTVTGMIAWVLHAAGKAPTVMNGAVMKNFATPEAPFASALVGGEALFVSEVDESDGSIALYRPEVAVVTNISLDHKSMEELRSLFGAFTAKAKTAVLNLDNGETAALAAALPRDQVRTFSLHDGAADFTAGGVVTRPDGVDFDVMHGQQTVAVRLSVPGRHNVANALAALAAVTACGVPLPEAAAHLGGYVGIKRRMDLAGTAGGVTVIDDFGHNPDKIAATLDTLHDFPGRLLLMFQPHGYGPLRLMGEALVQMFVEKMAPSDVLLMPEPVYFGGTVDRSVGSDAIAKAVAAEGRHAEALPDRAACGARLLALAQPSDRIVVMGARDDTLSDFAAELVAKLQPAAS